MGVLDGRKALVTGASGGIGVAIATRLAADGAAVACHGVPWEPADGIAAELRTMGHQAVAVCANLMDDGEVRAAVQAAVEGLGGLDILVNNAGVTKDTLIVKMDPSAWDLVLGVNLLGAVAVTEAAIPALVASGDGRIINMASVVGLMGNAGQANYGASKAGLIAFTKVVARRFGNDGVKANAIAPGFIQTRMTAELTEKARAALTERIPLTRLGDPEDVAGVCAFLSGPDSAYMTGQVLGVDGGMVMA